MKKRLSRREFLRGAGLAAAGSALAACAPQTVIVKETVEVEKEKVVTQVVEVEKEVTKIVAGTPVVEKVVETKVVEKVVTATPAPKETVTLSYATWMWPARQKVVEESMRRFESLFPEVKVELQGYPSSEYHDKIVTLVAGGAAPDTFHSWVDMTILFIESGLALDLQPYIERDGYDEDNLADCIDMARYEGHLYGFPRDGGAFGDVSVYYNIDLFNKAGIPLPESDPQDPDKGWTWDDLLQMAKALTRDTNGDGKIDQWGVRHMGPLFEICLHTWSNGGEIFNEDNTKCLMDMPETIEAIQWYADLTVKHRVSPLPDEIEGLGDVFMSGQNAIYYAAVMYANQLLDAGVEFDFAVAQLPRGKAGAINVADTHPIMIATSTLNPDACWEWLKYTVSDENQRFQSLWAVAFPPQTKSIARSEDFTKYDGPPHDMSSFVYGETRMFPKTKHWRQAQREIIMPDLDPVFLGDATAAEVIPGIVEKVDKLLAEG
jgi:multiple sugar transport system substrate-binding protein